MASMKRKFIGTARGCGSLRGKCDQVGACELWELVDLVVHDGRGEWHRNGECCCLLSNTTLLCCTETESEQADLHIANSHHYVFNKAAAVRLRKVLNKAAAPATRGNLRIPGKEAGTRHCFSTIGLKILNY